MSDWQVPIGFKNGMVVYASETLIAQKGLREVKSQLGLTRRYPVKTAISSGLIGSGPLDNIVMVEASSQEEAIHLFLTDSKAKK